MRKNMNKIVAVAIGISVMSGNIMPVFAADTAQNTYTTNIQTETKQKPILTLDDAIKEAISISDTLALDIKNSNYQSNINDINEDSDDFNDVDGDKEDFNDDTRDITLNQVKQQRDFDEDKLIQKTTKAYNDIVTSQMKIDKAAKELEIENTELEYTKFKESLGMVTSTDLKSTELEIQNLQNTQKSSENALKDAQDSFKVLTGKDVAEYSLEQDIKLETFKIDGSLDEYLDNVIDNYLKYTEQLVKLNKDYYYDSDNKVTESDVQEEKKITKEATKPTQAEGETYEQYMERYNEYENETNAYTSAVSGYLTYLKNKLSVEEDQTSLNENKKNFKEQLKTIYTNLLTSEDNINYYKKSIELNNKKLSDAKFKYDLGMITQSDYNTQVVDNADLDLELRSEIDTYNTLKEEIQKPWVAFS